MRRITAFFRLDELGSSLRTEVVAGITTFMTMAYIIFVNPSMLAQAGMDFGGVMAATCISAAAASILMGLFTNYPIALATGMGENAFFAYTVCLAMRVPWRVALGCVFVTGLLFIVLTLTKFRQALIDAIPASLRYAIAGGIGLFIAFIGLADGGLVVASPATLVASGDLTSPPALLAVFGLLCTGVLFVRKVRGALLWGILATAGAGMLSGIIRYGGLVAGPPSMASTFLQMDLGRALSPDLAGVIFVFLFMGIFDTVGTLAGIGEIGGFMRNGKLPKSGRAMTTDAVGTCIGAACGTPTVTCYIESASGIAAGGRSGLVSVVVGLLFIAALFFAPLVTMIGGGVVSATGKLLHPVTAPALIVVGSMMLRTVTKISWEDYSEALPAFITLVMMPLTFSIATGIAAGFVAYAALKLFSGRGREVSWIVYLLAAVFVVRFIVMKVT